VSVIGIVSSALLDERYQHDTELSAAEAVSTSTVLIPALTDVAIVQLSLPH
jgi:hypothetical protein